MFKQLTMAVFGLVALGWVAFVPAPSAQAECRIVDGVPQSKTYNQGDMKDDICDTHGQKPVTVEEFNVLISGEDQDLDLLRVNGGAVETVPLLTNVIIDGSGATVVGLSGGKTPMASIAGTGPQSATVTVYGDYTSTATEEFEICVMSLSGTTTDAKKCSQFTDDFPFYHAKIASLSGTDATVNVWLNVGVSGTGTVSVGTVTIGTFPDNEPFNVAQINGVTPLMGAGNTGTGSPRVTIATDQAALAGLGVYTEDNGETAGGNLMMSGSVRRDVAASSAGTTGDNATLNTDANGLLWVRHMDPCNGVAKSYIPINISTATTTELTAALAGASNHYYVCGINLVAAAAQTIAIADDDSDGCGSVTSGLAGGTTAATGWSFAANGGIVLGNGSATVLKTGGTNRVICAVTGQAAQISGTIIVVAAP